MAFCAGCKKPLGKFKEVMSFESYFEAESDYSGQIFDSTAASLLFSGKISQETD